MRYDQNDIEKITTSPTGMKEIHFLPNSEFGMTLMRQIKSVDDGTKFLSAEEFLQKYEYLGKNKK